MGKSIYFPIPNTEAIGIEICKECIGMAIKGLRELLSKFKNNELTEDAFETELNKNLPEDWIPKMKYNELSESKKLIDKQFKEQENLVNELKNKANLSDEYKNQIAALQAERAKQDEEYKTQLTKIKRDTAIDSALATAKARNAKAVRSLLDDSKIMLGDDGKLIGLNEQIEALIKSDSYLFENTTPDPRQPSWGNPQHRGDNLGGGDALAEAMFKAAGLEYKK